jgi:NTP pyrophosphatase (non-canonical NTP hydrolase)
MIIQQQPEFWFTMRAGEQQQHLIRWNAHYNICLHIVVVLLLQVGEVGELSEIFQWKGEVPRGLADWNEADKEHLGEELSDVLLYLVRLADVCDIDLGTAALRKLQKNALKYPVSLCKGSS